MTGLRQKQQSSYIRNNQAIAKMKTINIWCRKAEAKGKYISIIILWFLHLRLNNTWYETRF